MRESVALYKMYHPVAIANCHIPKANSVNRLVYGVIFSFSRLTALFDINKGIR